MAKKHGLGKGLDAILPADIMGDGWSETPHGEALREIPLQQISPNPMQPRAEFEPEALRELAESIEAQGVLQPIIVAPADDGYVLIVGERRWRAAQIAKLDKIPAIVLGQKPSDEQLLFIALVENLQRENLDAIEEAEAYKMLADRFGLTQEKIAHRVGKSRPAVTNALRLLRLPPPVVELVRAGKISAGHARILLEEKDAPRQLRLANLVVRKGLSVERLSILVLGAQRRKKRTRISKSPEIIALEEELTMALGTKVEIRIGKRKKRLIIEFYDDDEMLRAAQKLCEL